MDPGQKIKINAIQINGLHVNTNQKTLLRYMQHCTTAGHIDTFGKV